MSDQPAAVLFASIQAKYTLDVTEFTLAAHARLAAL